MQLPVVLMALAVVFDLSHTPASFAAPGASPVVPADDYALYDQAVTRKFLTDQTQLVLVERATTTSISPRQAEPLSVRWFEEEQYFDGTLPADLVCGFIAANQTPSRLEGRFGFGVRYRFVSGETIEEPEVSLARPLPVSSGWPAQWGPVLDRLVFSRIGYDRAQRHALLYVGNPRPDGTGAGFLVWFRRQEAGWGIWDTEVIWTVHIQPESDGPLLAP